MLTANELDKVKRYVNGEADVIETQWVESMLLNGEKNEELRQLIETDWNQIHADNSYYEIKLKQIQNLIHNKIRREENQKRKSLVNRVLNIYSRAAAILLLPLFIAGYLGYMQFKIQSEIPADQKTGTTIFAPLGSRVSFNLPDGTSGMLNSGSTLTYSTPFSVNRKVNLTGEAWLDVHHDEKHPFEITSGSSTVKVLGTKFNISAYPTENYVEVVLEEGKVEYLNHEASIDVDMFPQERLVFQAGQISKSITDVDKYNSWTAGKLVFRGDPMSEVARRIERWYNVKVELSDKQLEKYTFRATFIDDSLEDVLRFLSMTSPIKYTVVPSALQRDGTYEKEKAIIHLRKI
jgi:ferric-dicitrate binding protein FerR (iron transport regulator)